MRHIRAQIVHRKHACQVEDHTCRDEYICGGTKREPRGDKPVQFAHEDAVWRAEDIAHGRAGERGGACETEGSGGEARQSGRTAHGEAPDTLGNESLGEIGVR